MAKYKCSICGKIYDEAQEKVLFKDLNNDWKCPDCTVPKALFTLLEEDTKSSDKLNETPSNAVNLGKNNIAIERDLKKCINCGICKQTCKKKENMDLDLNGDLCVACGQCIMSCPVGALFPKSNLQKLKDAKESGKICIAYISPSVRVSFKELFLKEYGSFEINKLVGFLKEFGFDYVFDTTFAADLTIMEEASEFVDRLKNNKNIPMFTSCCPAWIKYAEQFHKEILANISTCKSPIGMMGPMVKEYFSLKSQIDKENMFTVAITPCTAKKYEINREEIQGTDLVITISEFEAIIKSKKIKYEDIKEKDIDNFFCEGSGAGTIFGNTGGVMEAALRTAYYLLTGSNLNDENIEFKQVRGYDNVREASIKINNEIINVCVIHGVSNVSKIIEDIKNNKSKYHFIEVMNCEGGCIGGGGQPKVELDKINKVKEKRIEALYKRDENVQIRCSHNNSQIVKIYKEFLQKPLSDVSHRFLHTKYEDKSNLVK